MNKLTNDYIAIDTNVFEQLLNPQENTDNHIDKLLGTLATDKVGLVVDKERRTENEYKNRFILMFKNSSEKNTQQLSLLRYWIIPQVGNRKRISVSNRDQLMEAIRGVITENEAVDRIFVYVAFKSDRILITNDRRHIIKGGLREKPERRKALLRKTRKCRPNQRAEMLSSIEAAYRL